MLIWWNRSEPARRQGVGGAVSGEADASVGLRTVSDIESRSGSFPGR